MHKNMDFIYQVTLRAAVTAVDTSQSIDVLIDVLIAGRDRGRTDIWWTYRVSLGFLA